MTIFGMLFGLLGTMGVFFGLFALVIGQRNKMVYAITVVSLVVAIIGYGSMDWSDGSKNSYSSSSVTDSYGNDKYDAMAAAEKYVKGKLKSPSTAKFSGESATLSGSTWTVTGTVDAQNGFGATVRSTFRVTVKFTGKNRYEASGSIN